jgi:hypothetical protein
MDYKYKYFKYKNKYTALKKQYAGSNSIILPHTIIKVTGGVGKVYH